MRVFAGPNGSGKSTIFNQIASQYDIGYYVNADDIEKQLLTGNIRLSDFGLQNISTGEFSAFLKNHSLFKKAEDEGLDIAVDFHEGIISKKVKSGNSYEAAFIADFLRQQLIEKGSKLTFETVMSHSSKLDTFDFARQHGFKNYLYFICTESPQINIERVKLRVARGGHFVSDERIVKRYENALMLLKPAVSKTYRTFLWDNSGKEPKLILDVFKGKDITFHTEEIPNWVEHYLLR